MLFIQSNPEISEKYGKEVTTFFGSNSMLMLIDKRHETSYPLNLTEEEALIEEYVTKYGMDGNSHPDVQKLLNTISSFELVEGERIGKPKYRKVDNSFSIYDHFNGLLLLVYENFLYTMKKEKFNTTYFEHVLIALGEHPTISKTEAEAKGKLEFSFPNDYEVVKHMLLEDNGTVHLPLKI